MSISISEIVEATNQNNGGTFEASGSMVKDGYVVSENPELSLVLPSSQFNASSIAIWIQSNKAKYIGTWINQNQVYLDVVKIYQDRQAAIRAGFEHNQKAIFDLNTFSEITTFGTGRDVKSFLL
jgi:hypothetical protein